MRIQRLQRIAITGLLVTCGTLSQFLTLPEKAKAESTITPRHDVPSRGTEQIIDYTIRPGDTLFDIERKQRSLKSYQDIALENGIDNPWWIYRGHTLRLHVPWTVRPSPGKSKHSTPTHPKKSVHPKKHVPQQTPIPPKTSTPNRNTTKTPPPESEEKRKLKKKHGHRKSKKAQECARTPKTSDRCLNELISRESNWDVRAHNPQSGAYGLPQANPPDKMRKYGEDWRTNAETQLRYMRKYIAKRYGTSCNALAHQKRTGWY